jgi:hypothetical protein
MKMNIKEIRELKICIFYVLTKLDIFHKFEDSGEGLGFRFSNLSVYVIEMIGRKGVSCEKCIDVYG